MRAARCLIANVVRDRLHTIFLGASIAKLSAKMSTRITTHLKKFQSILAGLQKRDVSEADTVTVINDMLFEICGYDKYLHITSQYAIRGTYVDWP